MDKRELVMYSVQNIIEDLLKDKPIKSIARSRKISKNTVKKYRDLYHQIIMQAPDNANNIEKIMEEIRNYREVERFSENHGWLELNKDVVEELSGACANYVRLVEVLHERGFKGSYSSLLRYLDKNRIQSDSPIVRIETKTIAA